MLLWFVDLSWSFNPDCDWWLASKISIVISIFNLSGQPNPDSKSPSSMEDYYKLQQLLLQYSLLLIPIVFPLVWFFYSIDVAFNYLLGASVGVLYLRILFKDVEKIGVSKGRVGSKGLMIFSGLIIVACRWQHLHVVPVFLGFLTYKVAIMIYMIQSLMPKSRIWQDHLCTK